MPVEAKATFVAIRNGWARWKVPAYRGLVVLSGAVLAAYLLQADAPWQAFGNVAFLVVFAWKGAPHAERRRA